MSGRKSWKGPFQYRSDRTCVKCDERGEYSVNAMGMSLWCCREHAIEGLCSKEGGLTKQEAVRQIAEVDADRLRSMNTRTLCWIPVSERLPPYGASVWTWDGSSMMVTTWWPKDRPFDPQGVTHWMPLPKPPEVTK